MDKNGKKEEAKLFYKVTNFTPETFSPSKSFCDQQISKSSGREKSNILSIFSNFLPWGSQTPDKKSQDSYTRDFSKNAIQSKQTSQSEVPIVSPRKQHQLKYCMQLTMEHVLIGNESQLDAISIGEINNNSPRIQKLWEISLKTPISLLNIDLKKNIIAIISNTSPKLFIYRYNSKKIRQKPKPISCKLFSQAKYLCFIKDILYIIYEKKIQSFTINQQAVKLKQSKNFSIPENLINKVKYLTTPSPLESTINIFFEEPNQEKKSMFTLWVQELECSVNQMKIKGFKKVYEIQERLKKKIKLKNFMKDTFLMNLGWEILAFKQGYIIDSVSMSSAIDNPNLIYLGEEKLVHVSDRRIEIYEFRILTKVKPYKIEVKPRDSIILNPPKKSVFFTTVQVFNNNLLLVFKQVNDKNTSQKKNVKYWVSLTEPISLREKFDRFFNGRSIYELSDQSMNQYFDISEKMGLHSEKIFYELWNRSNKSESDFHYLLKTKNYTLINDELCKILKKRSLPFTEVYKLNRNCFFIHKQQILNSSNPTKEMLIGLIQSACLLKKLEYFRDIWLLQRSNLKDKEGEGNHKLMVSIKIYHEINEIHIIHTLVELITDLVINKKPVDNHIRMFLTIFKFPLRMVYHELLSGIIEALGKDFNILIQKIPEILPYQYSEEEKRNIMVKNQSLGSNGFFDGIWGEINNYDKDNLMHFDNIVRIDNREIVTEVIKQVNFRRGFLSTHCFIAEGSEKILEQFKLIQSEGIFYYVIKEIIKRVRQINDRKIIFGTIENKYYAKLAHLKDKINLYYHLHYYLQIQKIVLEKDGKPLTLDNFLCLRDYELFGYFFRIQKNRKGLILNEIKPIFEENNKNDPKIFNQCLLEYFKQPVSELSDIKYLLNRINNEKKQFHISNQHMYQILVDAMTYKLAVGTDNDIPLKQVLIYIDNVPMNRNRQILSKLSVITEIDKNISIIQAAKVNMSIYQIINTPNQFIGKICEYLIIERNVSHHETNQEIMKKTYNILATLQFLHNEIYKTQEDPLFYILFIYIVKLAVDQRMFPFIKCIINDQYLLKQLNCTAQYISDVLGLYLFKSSMTENRVFMENEKYLRGLMLIFSQGSKIKDFIIFQFEYAKILSNSEYQIEYPLSPKYGSPGISELETALYHLPANHILNIKIDTLYTLLIQMKHLYSHIINSMNAIENEDQVQILNSAIIESKRPDINKRQVYELFIMRLLNLKKMNQVVPYIERYFQLTTKKEESGAIVFAFLFLSQLSDNLNHESLQLFFRLSIYLFDSPKKLFRIIKDFMLEPRNIKQRGYYLRSQVQKCQQNQKKSLYKFKQNKMLNKGFIQTAFKNGLQHNLIATLEQCYLHTINSRQQFGQSMYSFAFIILISKPELLPKYFLSFKKKQSIKNMKMFLSFLTKQSCFDKVNLLQFASRIFLAILHSFIDEKDIMDVMDRIGNFPIEQELDDEFYQIDYDWSIEFLKVLQKTSISFKSSKKKTLKRLKDQETEIKDKHYEQLMKPELIMHEKAIQLSDNEESIGGDDKTFVFDLKGRDQFNEEEQMIKLLKKAKKKRRNSVLVQKNDDFQNKFDDEVIKEEEGPDLKESIPLKQSLENVQNISLKENSVKEDSNLMKQSLELPKIHVHYKKRDSSESSDHIFDAKKGLNKGSKVEQTKKSDANKLIKEENQEKQKILKPGSSIKEIISQSSLQNSEQSQTNNLEFKDFFGPRKVQDHEHELGEDNSPLLTPTTKNKKNFRRLKEQINKSVSSMDNSMGQDQGICLTPTKRSQKSVQISKYKKFAKFPLVEQLGLKIYRNNLLLLDNPKSSFKLSALSQYENQPQFKDYMFQMIRYLYYESTETSLIGIMRMISFIIDSFRLGVNKSLLQIWVRAYNLSNKYSLELCVRQLIPIQTLSLPGAYHRQIFEKTLEKAVKVLDDINLYKIAKMLAMAFQQSEYEYEVILAYLKKIAFNSSNFKRTLTKSIKFTESQEDNYLKEKVEKLCEKLPVKMICQQMEQIYLETKVAYKENMLTGMVNKVKSQGSHQQKMQVYQLAAKYDSSYEKMLQSLHKKER